MQQPALLGLPTRHQLPLCRRRRLRGETSHLLDAVGRLVEAPGEQQRGGDQAHQVRRAEHQVIRLLLVQTQQQRHVLFLEQVIEGEVVQQAGRHLELFGGQGLFHRRLPVAPGTEPLAGAAMPGTPGRPGFVAQQQGQRREDPQPFRGVVPGFDKTPQLLQGTHPLGALPRTEQVLAKVGIEARQMHQHAPGLGQLRRQGIEQFVLQVVEQGRRTSRSGVGDIGDPGRRFQHRDPHPGAPTGGVLLHPVEALRGQGDRRVTDQLFDFAALERQARALDFVEFTFEQQPWPVAVGSPPHAQPPVEDRTAERQQAIEQLIQRRVGQPTIVVEKNPGRGGPARQTRQQARFVLGLFQPKCLGQGRAEGVGGEISTGQRQPAHATAGRGLQQAFGEQGALAAAGGRAEQADPCLGLDQGCA